VILGCIVLLMQNSDKICKPFDLQQKFSDGWVDCQWSYKIGSVLMANEKNQAGSLTKLAIYWISRVRVEVVNFMRPFTIIGPLSRWYPAHNTYVIKIPRGFSNDFTTNLEVLIIA
jgi:hypothetical protein